MGLTIFGPTAQNVWAESPFFRMLLLTVAKSPGATLGSGLGLQYRNAYALVHKQDFGVPLVACFTNAHPSLEVRSFYAIGIHVSGPEVIRAGRLARRSRLRLGAWAAEKSRYLDDETTNEQMIGTWLQISRIRRHQPLSQLT